MSDSNISVKITADIQDLQVKLAVAKAEVNGLTLEMSKLAKQSAAGLIDSASSQRLQQVAGDLLAARQTATGYSTELEKAGFATSTFGRSLEGGHGSISTATREFRALFDELSSGRTRQTPGTLAIIAQRVIGLGPAALGAVAGVGVLAGGIAFLTIRAMEASKALDQAFIGAQFAGNMEISRENIKKFQDEMTQWSNISGTEARQIIANLSSIPGVTTPVLHALTAEVSDWANNTKEDSVKASEALAKSFNPKTSAAEFARSIGGVTQGQLNMAEAADRSGNAARESAAKLELLIFANGRMASTIDENATKLSSSRADLLGYSAAVASGTTVDEISNSVLARQLALRQRQADILKQTSGAIQNKPEATLQEGLKVADKENPVAKQITDTTAKIESMEQSLKQATDPGNIAELNSALAQTRERLSNLQFGPVLDRMREQIGQVAAAWDGTQSGMLAKQTQIAQAVLADVQKNSKEELAVKSEIARLEVQQRQAAGAEIIANARTEVATLTGETSIGALQRLQKEREVWQQLLTGDRLTATQRTQVARELATTISSANREGVEEARAIARSAADTDIAIAKQTLEAKRAAIESETVATEAGAARKLAALRQLTAATFALDDQVLQNEMKSLEQQPAEYAKVYDQERQLKAKLVADLAKLDQQNAADVKRAAAEEVTSRKLATNEILNAEGTLVSDLIGRRKTLSQSLLQIGQQLVTQEITNDLKAMTAKMLIANKEEADKKSLALGGLLFHKANELGKTTDTTISETAQTAATSAGEAARLAAQASGAAAGKAISATAGASQVMADAAKAAAGAYSAVAGIPYVGPVLAPIAAGVAYAAVAGYESMASLDTGTNYVPRDMQANIHEGEAIVPKKYNPAAGGSLFGSGRGGGGGGGDMHVHMGPSMNSKDVQRAMRKGGALEKEMRNMHRRGVHRR